MTIQEEKRRRAKEFLRRFNGEETMQDEQQAGQEAGKEPAAPAVKPSTRPQVIILGNTRGNGNQSGVFAVMICIELLILAVLILKR